MKVSRFLPVCLLVVSMAFYLVACAHGDASTKAGRELQDDPSIFLPLAIGNQWTYGTSFRQQQQPELTVRIVREQDGLFVDDRPTPGRMRFDGVGIRDANTRYLLKGPLKQGTKWMSVADVRTVERYEIESVGVKIRVPAGVFSDCVTVKMEVRMTNSRSMVNRMTFAPHVGIVEIRTALQDGSKTIPQSRMVLKAFALAP